MKNDDAVQGADTKGGTEDRAMMKNDEEAKMKPEDRAMADAPVQTAPLQELTMEENDDQNRRMKGSYEPFNPGRFSQAQGGDVVLFFRASWCPTCRALDADIRSRLSEIPSGLVILDVDYDNSSELKQKYGVTYQHTFVQVDASGNQIAKWSGSPTLAALAAQVK